MYAKLVANQEGLAEYEAGKAEYNAALATGDMATAALLFPRVSLGWGYYTAIGTVLSSIDDARAQLAAAAFTAVFSAAFLTSSLMDIYCLSRSVTIIFKGDRFYNLPFPL